MASGARLGIVVTTLFASAMAGCFDGFNPLPSPTEIAIDAYLHAEPYRSLVFEVDWVEGNRPHADAISLVKQRAAERLNKPDGVTAVETEFKGGRSVWSVADLQAAESAHRDFRTSGTRAAIYVLYVNGQSDHDTQNTRILGIKYGPSSVAIFKDSIRGSVPGSIVFGVREVESAVVVHEFGHLLGLVNAGLPMVVPHEDPNSRGHSSNSGSVMWHAIETDVIKNLQSAPPTEFDCNDRKDIQAGGGKPAGC